ncbi:MAG: hypothetical protein M3452_01465, partial [Chloroflexota bacterium]|nr:hypothetical protein [Chloroflexota bacterium]
TAPVLSVVVGVFHTALYVLLRGQVGARLPLTLLAAILGAYAGQAIGARVGDVLRLGDYPLIWASVVAWAGILIIAVASTLGPTRQGR